VDIPGTAVFAYVPPGQSMCLRVRLTAATRIQATAYPATGNYIRAMLDGTEMSPHTGALSAASTYEFLAGRSFEWVRRIGPGNHRLSLQWKVDHPGNELAIANWTLDVEFLY
jgi:hypothetical protein